MEPIVSPWLFYFASVADKFVIIGIAGVIVSLAMCACFWLHYSVEISLPHPSERGVTHSKKWSNTFFVVFCICLLITTFVPSEKTILQMLVAQNVTYDLVGQTTDVVSQVYNDIINLFNNGGGAP